MSASTMSELRGYVGRRLEVDEIEDMVRKEVWDDLNYKKWVYGLMFGNEKRTFPEFIAERVASHFE